MNLFTAPRSFQQFLSIQSNMKRTQTAIDKLQRFRKKKIRENSESDTCEDDYIPIIQRSISTHATKKSPICTKSNLAATRSTNQPPNHANQRTNTASQKYQKKGNRLGAANYSKQDIDELLNIVAEREQIGHNHWARVAAEFNKYANVNERPRRTQKSLHHKFDKLLYFPKKTGDPLCPEEIVRAKRIHQEILHHYHSDIFNSNLGDEKDLWKYHYPADSDREEEKNDEVDNEEPSAKKIRKIVGRVEFASRHFKLDLCDSIERMSTSLRQLAEQQLRNSQEMHAAQLKQLEQSQVQKEDIEKIVAATVENVLRKFQSKSLTESILVWFSVRAAQPSSSPVCLSSIECFGGTERHD
ncbi:hypothetical protein FGB62_177g08 [Gracilaria domingensis]|nr:hypothetical protein FGB62_177g08 [Gracilaria domingensis]